MSKPLISVVCLTFNQEKYVRDMLNGLLMQETDYDVEYIIHDDASTDMTQAILRGYEKANPGVFKVLYETENQWSKGVKITQELIVPHIKGDYVAFCEGDDFWIDAHKLQEQADFLNTHKEYVCVAHNALCVDEKSGRIYPLNNCECGREIMDYEIIDRKYPFLAAASKMYRREAFILNDFFLECGEVGDMCTEYSAILKGRFYYIDKIMSVYRHWSQGSWSNRAQNVPYSLGYRAKFLRFLSMYNDYTNGKYNAILYKFMSRGCAFLSDQVRRDHMPEEEFYNLMESFNDSTDGKYDIWLKRIAHVIRMIVYSGDEEFRKAASAIGKQKDIYGAGDFGTKLASLLMNAGIDFKGFIVSSKEDVPDRYLGKNIFDIQEYSNKNLQGCIFVALDVRSWDEVQETLHEYGQKDYFLPFYITEESFRVNE